MALVTGGASCGKSAFAERLCMALGNDRVYLAAMKPFGEEGAARVRKHRAQRAGKGFRTIECFEGLDAALGQENLEGAIVLLECLGNVVANGLFSEQLATEEQLVCGIDDLHRRCRHLVVVGNEVGCDGECYDSDTHRYQEVLGAVTCDVALRSDCVVECIAGIPTVLKGDASMLQGVVAS